MGNCSSMVVEWTLSKGQHSYSNTDNLTEKEKWRWSNEAK